MTRRALFILPVIAAFFVPFALHAECVPSVQRLINERPLPVTKEKRCRPPSTETKENQCELFCERS